MQNNDRIVLDALLAGKELTDVSMANDLGVWNGRNSISRLRRVHDYNIHHRTGKSKNGARYKIYYINLEHPKGSFDHRDSIEYWNKKFNGTGPMRDELAKAMLKLYRDTGKDYGEIWPEPGTSVFEPIFTSHGFAFTPPQYEKGA